MIRRDGRVGESLDLLERDHFTVKRALGALDFERTLSKIILVYGRMRNNKR
jgi:hypothetical protein